MADPRPAARHQAHHQAHAARRAQKAGNGRHYSNALGFYIFKGNEGADQLRRKLVLKEGDEEEGGDFVFTCEPRFTRQQTVACTFEP